MNKIIKFEFTLKSIPIKNFFAISLIYLKYLLSKINKYSRLKGFTNRKIWKLKLTLVWWWVNFFFLFPRKSVLKEKQSIDDGIGLPDWKLTLCLLLAWGCIFAVLARGMKSSGKASYFLAIFPYIIMISLLVRAVTLDGAVNGIIFFIKPDWDKLFDAHVWYAAVTQCFFSLSVCFGGVVMYSSYNNFRHNIYRLFGIILLWNIIENNIFF